MSVTNFDTTYTGNRTSPLQYSLNIPSTAFNVTVYIAGGAGARGSNDGGPPQGDGTSGGGGRVGTFTFSNYTSRSLTIIPGSAGQGPVNQCGGCFMGGGQLGDNGAGEGGRSGTTGGSGSSGPGGGGGAASILVSNSVNVIVAGGGGGGGGGTMGSSAQGAGGAGGAWVASTSALPRVSGSNGQSAVASDGSSGGGGGGGVTGGGGGQGGQDFGQSASGGGGGGSQYRSDLITFNSASSTTTSQGTNGYIRITYTDIVPEISTFTVTNQLSCCNGIPKSDITFTWATVDAQTVKIVDTFTGSVILDNLSGTGNTTYTTGFQSIAGTSSPVTRTYQLQASYGSVVTTANATTSVYNDNTPTTITLPTVGTYISGGGGSTDLTSVNPNASIEIDLGEIGGVDMATKISGTNGLQARVSSGSSTIGIPSTASSSFASTNYFYAGNRVRISVTSAGFDTSPDGLTNDKSFTMYIGTQTYNFTVTTRAPDINETFSISDNTSFYPYPKINISSPTPTQFMETSEVSVNDIELSDPYGVRAKSDQANTQLRVKRGGTGSWETNSNTDASGWRYLQQGPGP